MVFLNNLMRKSVVVMIFLSLMAPITYAQSYFSDGGNHIIGMKDDKTMASLEGKYHLKCWQDGELLFEETDLDLQVNNIGDDLNSISFAKGHDSKTGVYLLTLGTSTCLYKKM